MNKSIIILLVLIAGILGYSAYIQRIQRLENNQPIKLGNETSLYCQVTHSNPVAAFDYLYVGNVLATSTGRRAYARIELPNNATNTVTLWFANGAKATSTNGVGLKLGAARGTAGGEATSTPYVEFGLNTDFPYTGAVSAISHTGTSSLAVTECKY